MHKIVTYFLIGLLLMLLVLIRAYENVLFYDPYLTFFKNDYLYIDSPRREIVKLVLNTTFRFVLNTLISLGILYLIFKDRSIIKFSALIYFVAYVLLLIPFLYFVVNPKQEDYYLFFNIRRFLIQPIILILLFPAFYYYKLNR
ncbi:exosortase F system-associated membrane protein [Winogradskyella damuponensis]|uniref:Exosortase F system-associated protein n=1 Tax=Winogradskyella damuponensis TaxID=943939 RepID=A0ABP8CLR6_9FLAO